MATFPLPAQMKVANFFGWTGVLAIISAFTLNIFQVILSESYLYIVLNIYGSFGIIVSSSLKKDFQPVALNAFWLLISFISLIRNWY